ncbi:MAG TPA: hypothetical protein VI981_04275 [Candidatus Paceibacterota bacterium]
MTLKAKIKTLLFIGVILILLQIAGIPADFKKILYGIFGIIIVWIAASLYRVADESRTEKRTTSFVESRMSDITPPKDPAHGS